MEVEPKIVFEGIDPSDFVRNRILNEIERLERFFGRVTACRVVISKPQGRRRHGDLYAVAVRLTLPGGQEVHATRNPTQNHAHEDAHVAIRDVFAAARRQLQDKARKLRGDVKAHEGPPEAIITTLVAESDYGFLEAEDGHEVYFHKNSVADDGFDKLSIGARVTYSETRGEKGPQATYVNPL